MVFLVNAFSLQMLGEFPVSVRVVEVTREEALSQFEVSAIGHEDTARVLGVPCDRKSISIKEGDTLFVAQLMGGRLPEGSTELPDGFSFKFLKVEVS